MTLPFSRAEFFSVFAGYNESVWPAQTGLYVLAIIGIVLAQRRSIAASRGTYAVLAVLWLWMGLVYHAGFFAAINPAALGFALIFVVQSVLFAVLAVRQTTVAFAPRKDLAGLAGGLLIVLGLVIYPVLSLAAGHRYPAQPTFGLPCPTTIFTLGLLLWARDRIPSAAFIIPLLWAAIGTFGAIQLGVIEDLSLAFSAIVVAWVWVAEILRVHGSTLKTRLGLVRWS
jgi:hypothetical protein